MEGWVVTLEFFGGLDFFLGDAKALAVVDVEVHFADNVTDNLIRLEKNLVSTSQERRLRGGECFGQARTRCTSEMFLALYAARAFARAKCT